MTAARWGQIPGLFCYVGLQDIEMQVNMRPPMPHPKLQARIQCEVIIICAPEQLVQVSPWERARVSENGDPLCMRHSTLPPLALKRKFHIVALKFPANVTTRGDMRSADCGAVDSCGHFSGSEGRRM